MATDYDSFLELYKNGADVEELAIDSEELNYLFARIKDENTNDKNRLKEELKIIIASRDSHGVSRSQIAKELKLNYNTIKTACSKYGNVIKNKANNPQKYKKLDSNYDLTLCPNCGIILKEMDILMDDTFPEAFTSKTHYCANCGEEFFNVGDETYYIDWAFID